MKSHVQDQQDKISIPKYIKDTFDVYVYHRKQIIINLYHVYKYFGLLKQFVITLNKNEHWEYECERCEKIVSNINVSKCVFCKHPLPSNIYGENNLLNGNILSLFKDLESIVIYTTSGQGRREYVFDLIQFIIKYIKTCRKERNRIIKCEIKATNFIDYYGKNDGNVELNRLNKSWIYNVYNDNKLKLNDLARDQKCKISWKETKNVGARQYDEDTLCIEYYQDVL